MLTHSLAPFAKWIEKWVHAGRLLTMYMFQMVLMLMVWAGMSCKQYSAEHVLHIAPTWPPAL